MKGSSDVCSTCDCRGEFFSREEKTENGSAYKAKQSAGGWKQLASKRFLIPKYRRKAFQSLPGERQWLLSSVMENLLQKRKLLLSLTFSFRGRRGQSERERSKKNLFQFVQEITNVIGSFDRHQKVLSTSFDNNASRSEASERSEPHVETHFWTLYGDLDGSKALDLSLALCCASGGFKFDFARFDGLWVRSPLALMIAANPRRPRRLKGSRSRY